ncbi:aldehyde dehydrogenase family protein [uncultured Erythrobacter sp.]|uniref:aldehyde dehydrogenase family protein n=1 Tax=uncultured Erythrobacter sp. TaxID=263913 RepID=UPI002629A391|nr:aldehyde dehydrogenase family protein [uncultured Erythrobacter sp.]
MTETYRNLIDGNWADGGDLVANINPSDHSDIIGHYSAASVDDVEQAIAAARRAVPVWVATGLEQRKAALDFIGDELIARCEEIGHVIAREEGKTIAEGKGEAFRSGQFFQYYAAECLRQIGEQAASVRPGVDVEVTREPVGVVGVITPWNFPVAVAAWKIAPALAFGNCVVLKPSETVPASAAILADIIHRSGVPAGVFNMVIGKGRDIGNALAGAPDIDAITFTGSVGVGRQIAQNAIQNMARIQLEMGSKNALVVLNDADMDLAVQCAIGGAFFGTGQKCTASSRLVVEQGVHDEFVERMIAAADALVVGHALDEATQIGPVVTERQLQQNLDYLELGKNEGAELATGGDLLKLATKGNFMRPAIFTGTSNAMRINREEIFGPITSIIKVADYDEALAVSNDTDFGLTSGIMTNSLNRVRHFKRHSQSGCVMVNLPTAGTDYHVPFGGRKASSYGPREQGTYAKDFYTIVKTTYIGG